MLISSSRKYESFVKKFLTMNHNLKEYKYEFDTFKDGEWKLKFNEPLVGQSLIYVCGFVEENDFLEFYDFISECHHKGVNKVVVICPYIRNSTQEKSSLAGNAALLKNRINLLSATPMAHKDISFYFLDLHSDLSVNYFPQSIRAFNIDSLDIFKTYLSTIGQSFVLTGADQGQFKRVERWAQVLQIDYACAFKIRKQNGIASLGCTGNLSGSNIVIFDDIIKTGETLLTAARTLKSVGVNNIEVLATHGAMNIESVTNLYNSELIQRVTCSDSMAGIKAVAEKFPDFLNIIPSCTAFSDVINLKC